MSKCKVRCYVKNETEEDEPDKYPYSSLVPAVAFFLFSKKVLEKGLDKRIKIPAYAFFIIPILLYRLLWGRLHHLPHNNVLQLKD